MKDSDKSKKQLIEELTEARGRVSDLEKSISRRLQGDSSSQHNELLFSMSFESADIGIAMTGKNKEFLIVNNAFCRMFSYTSRQFLEKTFEDVMHPDDRPERA